MLSEKTAPMAQKPKSEAGVEGILLVNKPANQTSFTLVRVLRRILNVKKIGHAGTLDPFATGLMVMLIGRNYTKLSDRFLQQDKEYTAVLKLGISTDSHDCDGQVTASSSHIPTLHEIANALTQFQGQIEQTPPMFSAKKVNGKKLYELARKGETIERQPVLVTLTTTLLSYDYPHLSLHVRCSKGTYVRTIADDLGKLLQCGAHLINLKRTRSGKFHLDQALDGQQLETLPPTKIQTRLITVNGSV